MAVKESLIKIHDPCIERISRELTSAEGVRAGFAEQLVRFYELLEQTIMSSDIAWLDLPHPIAYAHRANKPKYDKIFWKA